MAWTERLERIATQMRQRYRALDAKTLSRLIPPPELAFSQSSKSRRSLPIKSPKRSQALVDGHLKRKAAVLSRRESYRNVSVESIPGKRTLFPFEYPDCPKCASAHVIRAGVARGEQRYRCRSCRKTFNGNVTLHIQQAPVDIVCHRCGGENCSPRGIAGRSHSGLVGYCSNCGRRFTQGGRYHLDNSLFLLIRRIREINVPPDIRDELYAQACLDVLEGRGYTFNVELDVKAAFGRARGPWGLGSDHPAISERPLLHVP